MKQDRKLSQASGKARRKYAAPRLQPYGGIRSLTRNVGSMTLNDGGTNPKIKTT